MMVSQIELTKAASVISFRHLWINFESHVEILDCNLMVSHVLIYATSCDVDGFIVRNYLKYL